MSPVSIGMATIPEREDNLRAALDSLMPQADYIAVALNGYEARPEWLPQSVDHIITDNSKGDAMKFWQGPRAPGSGYFFSCDDDIIFPPDFIQRMTEAIEMYGRKVAVSLGGKILRVGGQPWVRYHGHAALSGYRVFRDLWYDQPVHVPITACFGYHMDTFSMTPDDCPSANMADIHVALKLRELGVPCIVVAHRGDWLTPQEIPMEQTIYYQTCRSGNREEAEWLNTVTWEDVKAPPMPYS